MTGYGKRGKPKTGFPLFPQPLEIAVRFPHSHRPGGERRWKSGNPKAGFPLSHCTVFPYQIHSERRPSCGSLRSRLQAHRSMRKCYSSQLFQLIAPGDHMSIREKLIAEADYSSASALVIFEAMAEETRVSPLRNG